jgi:anthraniloyl-CoA monooxygenase
MFQTPFADRIRQDAGIATIAVGAISSADEMNGIIASGRADLCAVSRLHLADPAWTLREVARLGYRDMPWPAAYRPGKDALERTLMRAGL